MSDDEVAAITRQGKKKAKVLREDEEEDTAAENLNSALPVDLDLLKG